jgi:hypothetical protein
LPFFNTTVEKVTILNEERMLVTLSDVPETIPESPLSKRRAEKRSQVRAGLSYERRPCSCSVHCGWFWFFFNEKPETSGFEQASLRPEGGAPPRGWFFTLFV